MTKIFWEEAPESAIFQWHPFFSDAPSLFSDRVERVHSLPAARGATILHRHFLPEREQWRRGVEAALQSIKKRELHKVVLARCTILECEKEPDPFAIAASLRERRCGATVFCLAENGLAFLGASPEVLFSRRGKTLASTAMGGTRKRGKTAVEDRELEQALFSSIKDHREWEPIHRHVQTVLTDLCKMPPVSSPLTIHKAHNAQHLFASYKGELKIELSDAEIARRLHPTPALCGAPAAAARALIRTFEPFDRGLYGGAIGWSTPDRSEWIAAIRSCLIEGKKAYLFAGTGIVEGSDPDEEWEELDQKTQLYEGIFA